MSYEDNIAHGDGLMGVLCNPNNSSLLPASNQLTTDCGYTTWCDPTDNKCKARGCRRDEFPFGYHAMPRHAWPVICDAAHFCPDEGSYCMPKIALGESCQLNRDDQCATTQEHHDVKCLSNACVAVDATENQPCKFENTIYTFFTPDNTTAGSIISRDNCIEGLYCDSPTAKCVQRRPRGSPCAADKECLSKYCSDDGFTNYSPVDNNAMGVCAEPPFHVAQKHAIWVYPVVIIVALTLFGILLCVLLRVHHTQTIRRHRAEKEYWDHQRAIAEKAQILRDGMRSGSRMTFQEHETMTVTGEIIAQEPCAENVGPSRSRARSAEPDWRDPLNGDEIAAAGPRTPVLQTSQGQETRQRRPMRPTSYIPQPRDGIQHPLTPSPTRSGP